MDELELKLETRTDNELIDARALRVALEAMLALLRTESNPATWRITDLQMGSNICAMRPDTAYDTGRFRAGLDTIREGRIPANWSVSSLRAAQTLSRLEGRRHVTGVKVTARASGQQMRFDRSLAQQIDSILSPDAATTWSMISGAQWRGRATVTYKWTPGIRESMCNTTTSRANWLSLSSTSSQTCGAK